MVYFIVNPSAASGRGYELWEKIKCRLQEQFRHVAYEVLFSMYAGHVFVLLSELKTKQDVDRIIVVGGDGTLHETINGLQPPMRVPIAFIPVGSSNDFARSLGLPVDCEESLALAVSKNGGQWVDSCYAASGKFSRKFINGLGIGYDGRIVRQTEKSTLKLLLNKLHISSLMYVISGLIQAAAVRPFNARVTHDGTVTEFTDCYMILAMVNPFEGGGIYFGPTANSTDGLTDLVIIHGKPRLRFICHVLRALFKKPARGTGYTAIPFTSAHVRFEEPQTAEVDGEYIGEFSEVSYQSLPQEFQLII